VEVSGWSDCLEELAYRVGWLSNVGLTPVEDDSSTVASSRLPRYQAAVADCWPTPICCSGALSNLF
jgi:hypothetical protein